MKKILLIAIATLMYAHQSFAQVNDGIVSSRCIEAGDSLDPDQAKGRNAWTMKCFPAEHTGATRSCFRKSPSGR